MSPRAAWRLESLGYREVAHYVGGIADWTAAGLPIEGTRASEPTVGTLADPSVPTCGPRETLGAVRERVRAAGWDTCFVVNERRVVLGRLLEKHLEGDPDAPAIEAMDPGPSTFRPDVPAAQLLDLLQQRDLQTAPVTRSDGTLVGLVRREDLERAVSAPAGHARRSERA
jgi:Mg/Co/Ni transporter MgtE